MEIDRELFEIEDSAVRYNGEVIYSFETYEFIESQDENQDEKRDIRRGMLVKYPYLKPFIEKQTPAVNGAITLVDGELVVIWEEEQIFIENHCANQESDIERIKDWFLVNKDELVIEQNKFLFMIALQVTGRIYVDFADVLENSQNDEGVDAKSKEKFLKVEAKNFNMKDPKKELNESIPGLKLSGSKK